MCHVAISVDLRDQVWRVVCTICLVMAYRAAMELGVASDITTCHWNCKKVHGNEGLIISRRVHEHE